MSPAACSLGTARTNPTIQGIREILNNNDGIEHVNEAPTMHTRADFNLINIGVDFNNAKTADEIKRIFITAEQWIKPFEVEEITP